MSGYVYLVVSTADNHQRNNEMTVCRDL